MSANATKAAGAMRTLKGLASRQGTCQRLESAALIVDIQDAVMMIGTRCSGRKATIAAALSRVEHIQRVFVDQR